MKLSSIPEARLEMTNTALADFFKLNGLPVVQITGRRASILKKWFANMQQLNGSDRAHRNTPYYGNGSAEDQRIRIGWSQYGYDTDSDTMISRKFDTRVKLRHLAGHKLPADVAEDVARMKRLSITICHLWESKQFLIHLT